METNYTKPKTKKFAVIGITAGLLLGAGGGLLMNLPGGASAKSATPQAISADDNSTDTSTPANSINGVDAGSDVDADGDHHGGRGGDIDPAAREAKLRETLQTLVDAGTIDASDVDAIVTALQTKPTTPPAADTTGARPEPGTILKARLQTLVDDGTLTSSQLDAVVTALEAARPMGGGHEGRGHGGPGMGGARGGMRQEMLTTAADAIGITADDLKTAIQGGQTMAQVAEANGKSVQSVIDALVAQATTDLTQRITDMVNGVKPAAPTEAAGATAGA
ncbi:unannotated protein [freshwater metagenome]|uniref:Unannotated protein n=1 Tax=freshwater metagenome TaxID=449393 RepID=A0A6J6ZVT1_9ZZZZ|nr:hypothetical protein [Actinomycetota bacterium]